VAISMRLDPPLTDQEFKYALPGITDPAKLCIDVLRSSHMRTQVRLSKEAMINLAENGVPHSAFGLLLRESLEEVVTPLLDWDGPDAMCRLWAAVAREGRVLGARAARQAAGMARVRGLRGFDPDERDADDFGGDDDDENGIADAPPKKQSSAWWSDEISGCPSSLEETVLVFLDSGFTPMKNPILAQKLRAVIKKTIKSHASKCRIVIPMSCAAFIVPGEFLLSRRVLGGSQSSDPYGVLDEGEIHAKSSHRNLRLPNGDYSDRITGDVLVSLLF